MANKKEFMKRSVRQTGVLKRLLFLRRRAWELAIGGSRLASLWCSLLTISSNNLINNDSRLSIRHSLPANFPSQLQKYGGNQYEFGARFLKWHHCPTPMVNIIGRGWSGNFESWFCGQKVPKSKNYFWDIYLCVMELPKPKTPCRPYRHFKLCKTQWCSKYTFPVKSCFQN